MTDAVAGTDLATTLGGEDYALTSGQVTGNGGVAVGPTSRRRRGRCPRRVNPTAIKRVAIGRASAVGQVCPV